MGVDRNHVLTYTRCSGTVIPRYREIEMTDKDVIRLYQKANRWDVKGLPNTIHDLRQFALAVIEEERERAVMICHDCRDWEYASEEIAFRIMNNG
jgi:hypothetical protein